MILFISNSDKDLLFRLKFIHLQRLKKYFFFRCTFVIRSYDFDLSGWFLGRLVMSFTRYQSTSDYDISGNNWLRFLGEWFDWDWVLFRFLVGKWFTCLHCLLAADECSSCFAADHRMVIRLIDFIIFDEKIIIKWLLRLVNIVHFTTLNVACSIFFL